MIAVIVSVYGIVMLLMIIVIVTAVTIAVIEGKHHQTILGLGR